MSLQQLITSICLGPFLRCRSQTELCCVPSGLFIISLNSDRTENLLTVRDFSTWQWDDSAPIQTDAGQLQTSGGSHNTSQHDFAVK